MLNNIFTNLDWLKRPDTSYNNIIKTIEENRFNIKGLEKINSYFINYRDSELINRQIYKIEDKIINSGDFSVFNLGIVSNINLDLVIPSLRTYALKNNIYLRCFVAPFGQTINFIKKKNTVFTENKLDSVLVAIDFTCVNYTKENQAATRTLDYIKEIIYTINNDFKAPCIVQNMINTPENIYGNLDFLMEDSHRFITDEINNFLKKEIKKNDHNIIFDVEKLSSLIGIDTWIDYSLYNLAKAPLSKTAIPCYANALSNILGSLKGKAKRLLILDLDNTLWGGILGDLGVENLELGNSSPIGEAHLNLQKYILRLRNRGILLAVASKNNISIALNAINKHPEMLIREDHLSAYEINWNDKAQNIINICNKVKLGTQSAVFLDDNPFERDLVRSFLPSVSVPELPNDPSYFVKYLSSANYFETTFFSDDDKIRTSFYLAEKKRLNLKKHHSDVNNYLNTLNMKAKVHSFRKSDLKRIEQLINKSNQFNLTTKRYSYSEISQISKNINYFTLQFRLSDIYGENGIIGIIILNINKSNLIIDTWIQSCRVLERKVENLILDSIIKIAKNKKIKFILGEYIETAKNGIVKDHYKNLGFSKKTGSPKLQSWKLNVEDYKKQNIPIKRI